MNKIGNWGINKSEVENGGLSTENVTKIGSGELITKCTIHGVLIISGVLRPNKTDWRFNDSAFSTKFPWKLDQPEITGGVIPKNQITDALSLETGKVIPVATPRFGARVDIDTADFFKLGDAWYTTRGDDDHASMVLPGAPKLSDEDAIAKNTNQLIVYPQTHALVRDSEYEENTDPTQLYRLFNVRFLVGASEKVRLWHG